MATNKATKPTKPKQPAKKTVKKTGRVGKPPINNPDDVKAIQAKIKKYFDQRTAKDDEGNDFYYRAPTFSGLTLALGYSSRTSLWEWGTSQAKISEPIKKACLMIDEYNEEVSHGQNCTGAIFALKCRGMDAGTLAPQNENDGKLIIDFTE